MPAENTPYAFPDIGPPTLKKDTEGVESSTGNNSIDEKKRLKAISITSSQQDSLCKKQKEIYNELCRTTRELQESNDELTKIHQRISSIQQEIGRLHEELNKTREAIQEQHAILDALASLDLSQTHQLIQKVIERHEANLATNLNNSVNKLFDYNNYN